MSGSARHPERRLVITVCPREPGVVVLPVVRGGRAIRMNARAVAERLGALVAARRLGDRVRLREGCAGGCSGNGPNVSVEIFPVTPPGERGDQVAIGWKTYVYSLPTLDCLATILDENLGAAPRAPARAAPRTDRRSSAGSAGATRRGGGLGGGLDGPLRRRQSQPERLKR